MNKHLIDEDVDLKKVGKTPVLLLKIGLASILVLTIVWGSIYIANLDKIEGRPIDIHYVDTGLVWVDINLARGTMIPGVNPDIILHPTDELKQKGKELYNSTCASCHGESGDGNGPASGPLNPKPRNYSQEDGWTNGKKFSDMYKTLQEGIQSRGMAAYEYIKPEDRIAILHYIMANFGKFQPPTADDVKLLEEKYSLSKGMKTENNVPVLKAKQILIKEQENKNNLITEKIELFKNSNNEASQLIKKVVNCPKKAFNFCLNSQEVLSSKDNFIKLVVNSINNNGFNTNFTKLNSQEVSEVYSYISGLLR